MKTNIFRLLFIFLFVFSCTAVFAERDVFGLGTGRNGAITINANTTINSYAPVVGPLASGDVAITFGTVRGAAAGFSAGDLVMVWQTTGTIGTPASGAAGPFTPNGSTGRWELARVGAVSGSALTLTAPLIRSYSTNVTQVIRVPEYTTVTINAARQITAYAWDGSCGGIIAFLATGTVVNSGQVNANAGGFRGGQSVIDASGTLGATGLDEAAPLGAQKGEGLAITRYGASHTGYGNVANAGGGGIALKSGGGGGGNGGSGGRGGRSDGAMDDNRQVGGLGGNALSFSAINQLFLGGGGGAGHNSAGSGTSGGRGGGVVFIRCNALSGAGTIMANGGGATTSSFDGGSGGGAGGTVYLRIVGNAAFSNISVNGGAGGSTNETQVGTGGGGAGGAVLYQRNGGTGLTIYTNGGAAGLQQDPYAAGGAAYGATFGSSGTATTLMGGMVVPATPVFSAPASGSLVGGKPMIVGTGPANMAVDLYLDGLFLATLTTDATGQFSYTVPTALSDGSHTLQATAYSQELYSTMGSVSFTSSATLPLRLLSFGAATKRNDVVLTWTTSGESRVAGFTVERSADGRSFTPIGQVKAANTAGEQRYSFTDLQSLEGVQFYRLRITEEKENYWFSQVVSLRRDGSGDLVVFPNPAQKNLHLRLPAGQHLVRVADAAGHTVFEKRLTAVSRDWPATIHIQHLPPGVYFLLTEAGTKCFIKSAAK